MQTEGFNIGNCPICCGLLEIVISINDHKCSIMCDECFAEWNTPENAFNKLGGFRTLTNEVRVKAASLDEIKRVNWEKYIIGY